MHRRLKALAREVDTPYSAVIATDPEGRILSWNRAAEELYGWSSDEVMGQNIVDVTPAELSRTSAEEILESLRDGRPWSGRFLVRGKTGEAFTAEVRDLPVRDALGRLVGIVGVSRRVRDEEP